MPQDRDAQLVQTLLDSRTSPATRIELLTQLPDLTELCPYAKNNMAHFRMEMQVNLIGAEAMICSLPVAGNNQHMGIIHGGANALLGETTGSFSACYAAGEGRTALGLDIEMHHHRPAAQGRVWCVAKQISKTKSLVNYALTIFRDDGKVSASGYHSCVFRPLTPSPQA